MSLILEKIKSIRRFANLMIDECGDHRVIAHRGVFVFFKTYKEIFEPVVVLDIYVACH